jgi:hypothetical protein
VPSKRRFGFHHQGFSPALDPTHQQHQYAPVMRHQLGPANLPFQQYQLLAQKHVLGDQFPLASRQATTMRMT